MSSHVDDQINLSLDELILQRKKSTTKPTLTLSKKKKKTIFKSTQNIVAVDKTTTKKTKPSVVKTKTSQLKKKTSSSNQVLKGKSPSPRSSKKPTTVKPPTTQPDLKTRKTNTRSMADIQNELQKKVSQLQRETTKLNQAKQVLQVTKEIEQLQARSRAQLAKIKFQHSQALSAKELELRKVKFELLGGSQKSKSTKLNIKDRIGPKARKVQVVAKSKKKPLTKAKQPTSKQVEIKQFKHNSKKIKIQKKVQKKKKN